MKNIAIILWWWTSQRCGFDKLFIEKYGKPIIFQTLETFQKSEKVDEIILVLGEKKLEKSDILKTYFPKIKTIILWGKERFFSLKNAIIFLENSWEKNSRIIVHNWANPKLNIKDLEKWIVLAKEKKNILFGFFSKDSIKEIKESKVIQNLNRDKIFCAQTPQISDLDTFVKAFKKIDIKNTPIPRDEVELLSVIGEKFHIFECSSENKKITFAHDFSEKKQIFRIWSGEDSHRFDEVFQEEKRVILGWVTVLECEKSLLANSDGDVILHSLINALLASIGWKTLAHIAYEICKKWITDSREYLKETLTIILAKHPDFEIQNVSFSLECKIPKISPIHDEIQENIAKLLCLNIEQVWLNYHTWEKLSDYGKWLGIKCLCSILVTL